MPDDQPDAGANGDDDDEVFQPHHMSRRRIIVTAAIGVVIIVAVFLLVFPEFGSYQEALTELGEMSAWWAAALIIAGLLNLFLYPFTVLVSVDGLTYWQGFVERQVGFLISSAVPGGGVFAVGAQYRILSRYGVTGPLCAAAVAADAVWTYLLTLGLPALGVVLLVLDGRSAAGFITVSALGLLIVAVSIVVIVVVLRSEAGAERVGHLGERLVAPLMHKLRRPTPKLTRALRRFRRQAHDLVSQRWKKLTLTNFVAQTTPCLVLICALGGLGGFEGDLSLAEVFAAYSIAILLVSLPVTPGGLGTVDAALVAMLTAFGLPGSLAVAADLMWRLVWYLPQILVGAATFVVHLVASRRAQAVARAA